MKLFLQELSHKFGFRLSKQQGNKYWWKCNTDENATSCIRVAFTLAHFLSFQATTALQKGALEILIYKHGEKSVSVCSDFTAVSKYGRGNTAVIFCYISANIVYINEIN